jgi:predicted transcriptional regulator
MAATWLPNVAINIKLKSKQEEYKSTVYVKDLEKTLVQKWGLSDDNNDVMLFGKDGKVLYSVDGKFTDAQVKEIVKAVWDNL